MITIQNITGNLVEVKISEKVAPNDFDKLKEVDDIISKEENIRLLLDGTEFHGWESFEGLKAHFSFVKSHHQHVNKIAILTGHPWHHCLAMTGRLLWHPKIKTFKKDEKEKALAWLKE